MIRFPHGSTGMKRRRSGYVTVTKDELTKLRECLHTTKVLSYSSKTIEDYVTFKKPTTPEEFGFKIYADTKPDQPWGLEDCDTHSLDGYILIGLKPHGYTGPWIEGDGSERGMPKAYTDIDTVFKNLGPDGGTLRWIVNYGKGHYLSCC